MKRGRSTGTPTKEEAEWLVAIKEGPCMACLIYRKEELYGCDAHHLLSGGRRIGHLSTIGLCAWHHRGVPYDGVSANCMREELGPSLMDGSVLFRKAYGYDSDILHLQREMVKGDLK